MLVGAIAEEAGCTIALYIAVFSHVQCSNVVTIQWQVAEGSSLSQFNQIVGDTLRVLAHDCYWDSLCLCCRLRLGPCVTDLAPKAPVDVDFCVVWVVATARVAEPFQIEVSGTLRYGQFW